MTLTVIFIILLALVIAFGWTVSQGRRERTTVAEDLSPESRTMLRRLKNAHQELLKVAERNKATVSPFVVQEALTESGKLLEQSTQALRLRDRIQKEGRGSYEAQKGVKELEERLAAAQSDEERKSLEVALSARQQELAHYGSFDQAIGRIDAVIQQAEAAMGEMRARLATHGTSDVQDQGTDDLREAIGRMRALTASVDEIEEIA